MSNLFRRAMGFRLSSGNLVRKRTVTAGDAAASVANTFFNDWPDWYPIRLAPSANIAAGAATATTAKLTAPGGKTSGADFQAGLISDDTNPLPSIDLGSGKYTELEWSILLQSPGAIGDVYQFRVTKNGVPLDSYSATPQLTVLDPSAMTATASCAATGTAALTTGIKLAANAACVATATAGFGGSYAITFTASENPLSDGGKWKQGLADGLDWNNVIVASSKAQGTEPGTGFFDDSVACVTGIAFNGDQQAQGTISISAQNVIHEVEILLRFSISGHDAHGYEILFSCSASNPYAQIVRWNGPKANSSNSNQGFTLLNGATMPREIQNGDVIKATAVGTVITGYVNGSSVVTWDTASDTAPPVGSAKYSSGSPGVGMYNAGSATNANFGFTDFSAQNFVAAGAALAANAAASATATAALTTSIKLAGAATSQATATAALTTGIPIQASAAATAAATAALTTAIKLAGAAASISTATGALSTAIQLGSSAAALSSATAALSTGIVLAANAVGNSTATAALTTTPAGIAASATCQASGTAALTTAIQLSANVTATASATAQLSTAIKLQASAAGIASATAALTTTPAGMAASAVCQSSSTAALTTAIQLSAAASSTATAAGDLTTGIALVAQAVCSATATADLVTLGSLLISLSAGKAVRIAPFAVPALNVSLSAEKETP